MGRALAQRVARAGFDLVLMARQSTARQAPCADVDLSSPHAAVQVEAHAR